MATVPAVMLLYEAGKLGTFNLCTRLSSPASHTCDRPPSA